MNLSGPWFDLWNHLFIFFFTFLLVNPSYKKETVDCLSEGLNKAVGIVGKVIFFIKHENVAPL